MLQSMMKIAVVLSLLCVSSLIANAKQNVIYHLNVSDTKIQNATLQNIQNHINAEGKDNLNIKVIMHGDGISLVLIPQNLQISKIVANSNTENQSKMMNLKTQGVQFLICDITLKRNEIKQEQLFDVKKEDIVPSGVAHIARLQSQGFSYIKP